MKATINGIDFAVRLPALDLREDLLHTWNNVQRRGGVPLLRVHAAMVALCIPEVAQDPAVRAVTLSPRAGLLDYGGEVYSGLTERSSWQKKHFHEAGRQLLSALLASLPPTEAEVKAAQGKSAAGAS